MLPTKTGHAETGMAVPTLPLLFGSWGEVSRWFQFRPSFINWLCKNIHAWSHLLGGLRRGAQDWPDMRHNYPLTLEGSPCRLGVMSISRSGWKKPAHLLPMWWGPGGEREDFHFQIPSLTRAKTDLRQSVIRWSWILGFLILIVQMAKSVFLRKHCKLPPFESYTFF